MKNKVSIDIPIFIFLIVLSAFLYKISKGYVAKVGFYPRMLLVLTIGLSVIALLETIVKVSRGTMEKKLIPQGDSRSLIIAFVFALAFGLGIIKFGLGLSSLLIMPLYMVYMGCRGIRTIIISLLSFFVFIYLFFFLILKIPMKLLPPFFF
jgi:hypothetical protein